MIIPASQLSLRMSHVERWVLTQIGSWLTAAISGRVRWSMPRKDYAIPPKSAPTLALATGSSRQPPEHPLRMALPDGTRQAAAGDHPQPSTHGLDRYPEWKREKRGPQRSVAEGGASHQVGGNARRTVIGRARNRARSQIPKEISYRVRFLGLVRIGYRIHRLGDMRLLPSGRARFQSRPLERAGIL